MKPGLAPLLSAEDLAGIVGRLAEEVERDHPEGLVAVGVLAGSVFVLADLVRRLSVPCAIDFLSLSAYHDGDTRVRIVKDIDLDLTGRDVVLVEDVVDTGLSAGYVVGLLERRQARSVRICTLLDRPARRIVPLRIDYVGIEAPEDFLIGYGLDYAGRFRNLPGLVLADPALLEGGGGALDPLFEYPSAYRSSRGAE